LEIYKQLIELWWSSSVFCEKSQDSVLYLGV
jgi:hypothetical protein